MPFLGTLVNFLTVFTCGILGMLVKKGIPENVRKNLMTAISVCVIYIGIDGVMEAAPILVESSFLSSGLIKVLIMIISMAAGTLIGELINIDKWVNRLGEILEKKFSKDGEQGNFAKGFVSCSLLFCVGAMAVNGAIADAVGDPSILIAKSVLDAFTCFMLAASYGIGCAFSAFAVLIYQGLISVGGYFLFSSIPADTLSYVSITGSIVIMLVGLNVIGATKIKTANMIPAVFIPFALAPLVQLIL